MSGISEVSVENLAVERGGKRVIHDISFSVAAGKVTTLLGANGAGKSSTVMAMAGVLPRGGAVRLGGIALEGFAPDRIRRAGLALVPEGHRVLGQLSVEDNILVAALEPSTAARRQALERAYEIFPELVERRRQSASDLSGGQKQMVAMAQAFVAKPRFMIVDELSLGLAPAVVKRLAEALKIAAAGGIGVLLIEQFANLALDLADKAIVLERGRLVFDGPAATLKAQPDILHGAYLAS
ncbi:MULTISPECIES: ABC transporter ATP-binding protein [unclassified Rhizobium]|uniref:ABC transporter ATP-binding protein n=1 Tax=unclassified Rhizobium TaxID=2613769 RepID=UPI0007EB60B9|nr:MULTISPECIES: ABC transporter ATP-binding protein [unclassified Rhizobium]ANM12991.1 high-affinity branched-chain amino acid ABC transporter ATP-binding protein [Rhizobium sp. N324]ANM19389.1 high-affinity branched-chain amino acid ABC transporter ATP-binding protein [Rhizobium sp. N541]ANM25774.1 high-affinity branched-chain amino acid ABC transporter ATP-binding protein [Rhizobium sp. N941]OYD01452.1 high-affinity branched-chain amino acid ABC transporter ATP-binding protein [Rhizobium sp.